MVQNVGSTKTGSVNNDAAGYLVTPGLNRKSPDEIDPGPTCGSGLRISKAVPFDVARLIGWMEAS